MGKIAQITSLCKKSSRLYGRQLLLDLQGRGFTDLRQSFLEILFFVSERSGPSIKEIGLSCGLKKQTMTSHLNELEKRGYIRREASVVDKREQRIFLTDYGERFRLNLFESVEKIEQEYRELIGETELDRLELILSNFHEKLFSSSGANLFQED